MAEVRIGRYRLDGVIGIGSFATVHKAVDDRLESDVVVKVLAENHSLNPEIRERFIAEGRSLRRVDSPYVVTVHDIGESERQQPFLVLEYADRGTLAERVTQLRDQGHRPGREDVLLVARSLARALEAVHSARLVHRDLSPNNVLIRSTSRPGRTRGIASGPSTPEPSAGTPAPMVLRPDEQILLADLGLCKDLARGSGLTVAGGTQGFRPPEMTGGPALVDTRADLWSLSALLTWLCEGAEELPDALAQTLQRSLAVDPDDRHPDVASWLADVESALATPEPTPDSAPPEPVRTRELDADAVPSPVPEAHPAASSARRWLAALVAALVLGLALGAGVTHWSSGPPDATQTARIAVEGPEQITVGEPATFTARHVGVRSWVWVLPTGEHVANAESVTITARTGGPAALILRSRDEDGTELQVRHRIQVLDADASDD